MLSIFSIASACKGRTRYISYSTVNIGYRSFCGKEEWRPIPGFPNYHASSLGNIKNIKKNRCLFINYDGFRETNKRARISLINENKQKKSIFPHRVILTAFNPIENHEEMEVNHKDSNFYNNKLENLEWVTHAQNMSHASKKGRFKAIHKKHAVKVTNITTRNILEFESTTSCNIYFKQVGLHFGQLHLLLRSKAIVNGYQFEYLDPAKYKLNVDDLKDEYWKQCDVGWNNTLYYVSNLARVKMVKPNGTEILKKSFIRYTHEFMSWPRINEIPVHRLVINNFVPNPDNCKFIGRKDGNPLNNKADNLYWVESKKEQMNQPVNVQKISTKMRLSSQKRKLREHISPK
eukprot:29174_1